jgi:hypothetical protein
VSSRTARAIQRNPISKKQNKTTTKKRERERERERKRKKKKRTFHACVYQALYIVRVG